MMLTTLFRLLRSVFRSREALILENAALRHQIKVLQRNARRPRLKWRDRALWDLLCWLWPDWRRSLYIVQPETVIRWHRRGFRLCWEWLSRPRWNGRPSISAEVRGLIREMSRANPLWGAPRIHGELRKLGYEVSESTVSKYLIPPDLRPSQTWRTFLANHVRDIAAIDFFTVTTATFRNLYVFLILDHARRRILHFNVTGHPTAVWAGQQIVEAFPWNAAPRFLLRDRDAIYGADFNRRVAALGIEQIRIPPRSPWQDGYSERAIGSIRRECLDHMIIIDEKHLRRVLREYVDYCHRSRTHLGLGNDCPEPRAIAPLELGPIGSRPVLGSLHHEYFRRAA